jgi:hypothetical protein
MLEKKELLALIVIALLAADKEDERYRPSRFLA